MVPIHWRRSHQLRLRRLERRVMRIVFPAVGIEGRNVKKRIPHKENKGITVVAKPSTKVLVFLLSVLVMTLVMVVVNHVMAGV